MIGSIVIFRSRTGGYSVPAIVTATQETRVHLTVFTPSKPGPRRGNVVTYAEAAQHPVPDNAGCYQEWDVPMGEADGEQQEPGTWRAVRIPELAR